MSLLISSQNLKKSYGGRTLFSDLSFGIFQKDKIGLIGPNGSGKSTLLKILAGLDEADEGIIAKNRSTKVGYVPQDTLFGQKPLTEVLLEAFENQPIFSEEEKQTRIAKILSKFGFEDPTKQANTLSGGWQKRLAIAKELVTEPKVLLLDEPTNHLDLEGVIWLENFLKNISTAYVVISHDRYFLEHITTRMWELDKTYPKGILTIEGSYSNFLEKKEEFLSGQLQQERSLNSKVRREMEWLKQNPKARTTKSTSRIQSAHALIQELQELKGRNTSGKSQIDFTSSKKDSQKLVVATNLTQTMGEKKLFEGVDFTLIPGTRLGVVGLNGSGKTTLLKLIAGEITPNKGTIKYADKIKIVYFDQHRAQLPNDVALRRALSPEGDTVIYKGQSIHVNSWCRRFLFAPDRLDLPFGQLSGGEKARVHIARLMLQPADVLLLDEPTNDLDIPTLEVLENGLKEFPGAIVIISHDRYMLDQISNLILGLGTQSDNILFADYRQWEQFQELNQKQDLLDSKERTEKKVLVKEDARPKKMSYNEKREWEQMEGKITELEKEISELHTKTATPLNHTSSQSMQEIYRLLADKQKILDDLYHRWQELESKL